MEYEDEDRSRDCEEGPERQGTGLRRTGTEIGRYVEQEWKVG
jgi:hypothetical protein